MKKTMKTLFGAFVVVAVMAGTAAATHVFDDVPDGAFYAEPAEWAADNGITLGCGGSNFCPDRDVSRGENITFAYRYDQNIVQPSLGRIDLVENETEIDDWTGNTTAAIQLPFQVPSNGFVKITYQVNLARDAISFGLFRSLTDVPSQFDLRINGTKARLVSLRNDQRINEQIITITDVVEVGAGLSTFSGRLGSSPAIPPGQALYIYSQTLTAEFFPTGEVP